MAKNVWEIRAYGMIDGVDNAFVIKNEAGTVLASVDSTGINTSIGAALSKTLASQTTEGNLETIDFTTDSTFLTGTDISFSGGRGSAALKITGTWSAVTGGYSNIYSLVTASGALNTSTGGPIGIKSMVQANAALTDASVVQGGQFIARHNHATNKAANAASFVGVEGVVTQNDAGQIGTAIGVSAAYHIPAAAAAFDGGAVWRGLQVTCDNSSGNNPSEQSGLVVWNLAGTQDNVINVVNSGSGFTYFALFAADGTPAQAIGAATTQVNDCTGWIKVKIGTTVGYINIHNAVPA